MSVQLKLVEFVAKKHQRIVVVDCTAEFLDLLKAHFHISLPIPIATLASELKDSGMRKRNLIDAGDIP